MNKLTADQVTELDRVGGFYQPPLELGTKLNEMVDNLIRPILEGTPVNAVNATKILTISGVVINNETVTIGDDVYEFVSDANETVTDPDNIPVNVGLSMTRSTRNLTVDTKPTSGDTMTIGTKVYTFVPVGTANADGEISVGADKATAQANIVAAINGEDDVNDPHPLAYISDFNNDIAAVTALSGGTAGNSIATTETFTAGTNVFAGVTLTGGANCSAANAVTALVAAIIASDTQGVCAEDGAGDTVVLTADVAGVIGNNISIAETMANGAFAGGAVKLSGGVNGTVGGDSDIMVDNSYLYICIATNTISGKNWRRIALGSAF